MNSETIVKTASSAVKTKVVAACGVALSLSLAAAGISAYLTAQDTREDNFTLNTNIAIDLPAGSTVNDLTPMKPVAIDSTISNTGSVDTYVAMTVKTPLYNGKYVDAAGKEATLGTDATRDLYNYSLPTGSKWKMVEEKAADGYKVRTYVYSDIVKGSKNSTEAERKAAPLFDGNKIVVDNLAGDPTLKSANNKMIIDAHAIQAEQFKNADEAFAAYNTQKTLGVTVSNG